MDIWQNGKIPLYIGIGWVLGAAQAHDNFLVQLVWRSITYTGAIPATKEEAVDKIFSNLGNLAIITTVGWVNHRLDNPIGKCCFKILSFAQETIDFAKNHPNISASAITAIAMLTLSYGPSPFAIYRFFK